MWLAHVIHETSLEIMVSKGNHPQMALIQNSEIWFHLPRFIKTDMFGDLGRFLFLQMMGHFQLQGWTMKFMKPQWLL